MRSRGRRESSRVQRDLREGRVAGRGCSQRDGGAGEATACGGGGGKGGVDGRGGVTFHVVARRFVCYGEYS